MAEHGWVRQRLEEVYGWLRAPARSFADAFRKWFFLATGLGGVTGFGVAGASIVAEQYLEGSVLDSGIVLVFLLVPVGGFAITWAVIRYATPDRSPATTEAFIADYHSQTRLLDWKSIPGKILAAIATVGSGGSMGFEGPSIFLGAASGATEQQLFPRSFRSDESKVMSVSGAAAGLAAIFRAPLTGVMFAVEGPYMFDLVRFAVAPSLIAAAVSYLVFTAIRGTTPFFAVEENVPLELDQFIGAIGMGIACAIATRLFHWTVRRTGTVFGRIPIWAKIAAGGLTVGVLATISFELTGQPLTLGEGVTGAQQFLTGDVTSDVMPLGVLFLLLVVMKMFATASSIKAGGVGGVFFPLSFMGAGIGAAFHYYFDVTEATFFPVLGIAGMISAAFRAPLTGAAFVAETTGNTSYLIPGLIAAATATSLMGRKTLSEVQAKHPTSAVTAAQRIRLRTIVADQEPPETVAPTMTLEEFAAADHRDPVLVEDGDKIVGVMTRDRLYDCHLQDRPHTTVADAMDSDPLIFEARMALRDAAVRVLAEKRRCAVVRSKDTPIGIITERDLIRGQELRRLATRSGADEE